MLAGKPTPAGFTPLIRVSVDGKEVAGAFYSRLIKATVHDEPGQKSDSCSIRLDDARNEIELPRKGAMLKIELGYRETGLVDMGSFKLQSITLEGDVESGEFMQLEGKAGDLKGKLKGEGSASYDDKTFGEIVAAEAKQAGVTAKVDPELAKIKLKYKARVGQSSIDFLTRLGDEVGAVVKPANGQIIVSKRGSGKSVSGQELPPITISKADCASWKVNPNGRLVYGAVVTSYVDQKTGKRKTERRETGLKGPDFVVKNPLPDQDRAKKTGEAESQRLNGATGDGSFTLYGRTDVQAEATVTATGFRTGINGTWRASAVEHSFETGRGFLTEIEVKPPESGKKGDGKADGDDDE